MKNITPPDCGGKRKKKKTKLDQRKGSRSVSFRATETKALMSVEKMIANWLSEPVINVGSISLA